MDYKTVFKSRKLRQQILKIASFIPDKQMIEIQYWIKTGRRLNLKEPKRFTEKLQYYKLYYRNPLMKQCVNKLQVREYVKQCGLENILNECYGIYDCPKDIDFSALPDRFVIKDTLGGGSTSVVIINDKKEINDNLMATMEKWISRNSTIDLGGREWPYLNQQSQIIIEKYLEQSNGDLADYKLFCFAGKVECVYVRTGYANDHNNGEMAFFDSNMNYLPKVGMDYCAIAQTPPSIDKSVFLDMKIIAEKLSKPFPHVRVDLYNLDGKIVFGELTFFNASGYMRFNPDEFDFLLGQKFDIEVFR